MSRRDFLINTFNNIEQRVTAGVLRDFLEIGKWEYRDLLKNGYIDLEDFISICENLDLTMANFIYMKIDENALSNFILSKTKSVPNKYLKAALSTSQTLKNYIDMLNEPLSDANDILKYLQLPDDFFDKNKFISVEAIKDATECISKINNLSKLYYLNVGRENSKRVFRETDKKLLQKNSQSLEYILEVKMPSIEKNAKYELIKFDSKSFQIKVNESEERIALHNGINHINEECLVSRLGFSHGLADSFGKKHIQANIIKDNPKDNTSILEVVYS